MDSQQSSEHHYHCPSGQIIRLQCVTQVWRFKLFIHMRKIGHISVLLIYTK
jgi:hypothetical protein